MPALLLNACLFDTSPAPDRPRARFDFARLDSLENPLAKWLAVDRGDNLAGVIFAFTSTDYRRQTDSNIAAFAAEAGGYPALAGAYFDISSRPRNLAVFLQAVDANGAVPFVTLDPKDWDAPESVDQRIFMSLVAEGFFDDTLKALARVFRDFGKPAFFRFAHEMNGDWYPYSGAHIGGGRDADGNHRPDGPERFIAAWRRVHGIFGGEGADKLVWVFCPNAESFPSEEWNLPFRYYPGGEYVDLISADAYEYPDKEKRPLEIVLEGFFNEMGLFFDAQKEASGFSIKPFGLSEFGTYRRVRAEKASWYVDALRYIGSEGGAGSRVKINLLYNGRNEELDFSIAGLGAWVREAYEGARLRFRIGDSRAAFGG